MHPQVQPPFIAFAYNVYLASVWLTCRERLYVA